MSKLPLVSGLSLLSLAVQGQSCIPTAPPGQLQREIRQEFVRAFPNVQVEVNPQSKVIAVLTCTKGLGGEALEQIDQEVARRLYRNPKLQQLASREARIIEALGQPMPYDWFVVGFEKHMLVWSRGDNTVRHVDLWRFPLKSAGEYTEEYDTKCGFAAAQQATGTLNPRVGALTPSDEQFRFPETIDNDVPPTGRALTPEECAALDYALQGTPESWEASQHRYVLRRLAEEGGCDSGPSP